MSPLRFAKPRASRSFLFMMVKALFIFSALCLTLTLGAEAQSGPICGTAVSPLSGTAPLTVTTTGGCTDATGTITAETLDWGDGTQVPIPSSSFGAFTLTHTYTTAGTFNVVLSATDSNNAQGSSLPQQVVVSANQPPTCTLSVTPTSGTAPLNVSASGSCTDPENDITSEVITWGDNTSTNGTSGTHTYNTTNNYVVTLTATDSAGNKGSAVQTVKVTANQPPTCTLSVSPQSGPAPLPVTATGSCTDPENDIVSTSLNWSDGTVSNGTSGTHTFVASGTYVVTLTATDAVGNKGKATQTVVVGNGQNKPPTCNISATPTSGQVPLNATVSPNCTDPENDITSITVDFGDGFYATVGPTSPVSHTYTRKGSFTAVVTAIDVAKNVSNASSMTVATTDTPSLFVGGSGQLKQFNQSGQSLKTLNPNQSGSITGMAFDWLDALYTTDFSANTVSKFDGNGNFVNSYGSGYNCKPESIVFDKSGNAYVGETGCSHALLKFDAYGNLAAAYSVATEVEGSDWIDLASDQCTIYYTSQGKSVFRFNACTGQQQAPFASNLTTGLAVKILPDQSVLVADKADIIHFNSGGQNVQKYTASGETCLVSLALDPDGSSFWAVDYCTADVLHFDISSGNQIGKFNSGYPAQSTYGLGMRAAAPAITPAGPLLASSQSVTAGAGQSASFDLAFVPNSSAVNQNFAFSCANLPVGAACNFSPSSATVHAGGTTVHVTITTTAAQSARKGNPFGEGMLAAWTLLGGLFLAGERRFRRRSSRQLLGMAAVVLLLAALIACSASGKSGSSSGGNSLPSASSTTPASSYTVVLHATSTSSQNAGLTQSSTTITLAVQ